MVDGNLRGFLAALADVEDDPASTSPFPDTAVRSPGPTRLRPERSYLTGLLQDVRAAIKANRTLAETLATVGGGPERGFCSTSSTGAMSPRPMPSSSGKSEWNRHVPRGRIVVPQGASKRAQRTRQGVYCR